MDSVTQLSKNAIRDKMKNTNGVDTKQLVLQIVDHKVFDENQPKKGIKSRATMSDGTSLISVLVSDKAFARFDRDSWTKSLNKYCIIRILG